MPNHLVNVGNVELISLNDNLPVRSPFVAFPHTTIEQWNEYPDLMADHENANHRWGSLAIRSSGKLIIVDTGMQGEGCYLLDDMKGVLSGMLAPIQRETWLGNAKVLQVFDISKVGKIAGCRVTEGVVRKGARVRIIRDDVVVLELGVLNTLKRFKDEVNEVPSGQECGMQFQGFQDIKEGDLIECFTVEEIKREL